MSLDSMILDYTVAIKGFFVDIFLTEVTVNICYVNLFDKDVKLSQDIIQP